ncbi:MAG: PAS domain-containing sensor histidine kinase [Parafilimonas sp.]
MDRIKQFEALFNYATIGIIVTDGYGIILNFNKKAEDDFGYSKEEVIEKSVEILLPQALKTRHEQDREMYYAHPSPRAMGTGRDLFARRKDGTDFPVEVSLSNYSINDEVFVMAFVIDITIRKQHELIVLQQKEELEHVTAEIKKLNTSLEKKVEDRTKMLRETLSALEKSKIELSEALKAEKDLGELKSRFVSMASHEFKTPLSTILSSSFLLEKHNDSNEPGKRTKHIERIKNAVGDMKDILDDFLSLDKIEEGLIKTNIQWASASDCVEIIESVINEMHVNLKNGQQIIFKYDGSENVKLDTHLLKNICINLLSNAIKFSPENTQVEVDCSFKKNKFSLFIKDHGIGIAEEDRQHLFERFFRAKNAFNIQGTGLGLHIVAKYLELMKGSIEIESELDKGSVIVIHISN